MIIKRFDLACQNRHTKQGGFHAYSKHIQLPEGSLTTPRDKYHPPNDPVLRANLTLVNEYLQRTEIDEIFNGLVRLLLTRTDLPYNPYPGFVRRFREQAERFHLYEKSHEEIKEILCQLVQILRF